MSLGICNSLRLSLERRFTTRHEEREMDFTKTFIVVDEDVESTTRESRCAEMHGPSRTPFWDEYLNLPSTHINIDIMNTFLLILILLLCFIVLILAWFAISSCLGDEIRAAWSGSRTRTLPTTYGLQYAHLMGQGGHGSYSEHIEMENMMSRRSFDDD